jgi:hypothetical protein
MERKLCPGCSTVKPIGEFNYNNKRLGKRQVRCRDCTRLQVQAHYWNNHDYYIQKALKRNKVVKEVNQQKVLNYLSTHLCVDCDDADSVCLDFDHVRGKKRYDIARMIGTHTWTTIAAEIAKCEVRCANCHRRKTAKERGHYKIFA